MVFAGLLNPTRGIQGVALRQFRQELAEGLLVAEPFRAHHLIIFINCKDCANLAIDQTESHHIFSHMVEISKEDSFLKLGRKISFKQPKIELWMAAPFRDLERMKREMDQLWGSFLSEKPMRRTEAGVSGEWFPEFDLSETKDALVVKAEVPGINSKDIHISLVDNTLTIKGEKKQEMDEKNEK